MAKAKPGPRRLLRLLTFLLLLLAFALLARAIVTATFFQVSEVRISGDERNLVSDQIRALSVGQNILIFPESQVRAEVKKNLLVSDVTFSKDLPGKLAVRVAYRTPVLSWQSRSGRYLVDEAGVAYQEAGSEPVPQASDPTSDLALGGSLSVAEVKTTLRVLEVLKDKGTVLTINIAGRDVTIQMSNSVTVRLDAGGDLDQESSALQLILTQAKIDGRYPKTVDLRYAKPVVTF